MTDILIRDVSPDVLAAIDAQAARLGLSRSEYMRRLIAQDTARPENVVTVADLQRSGEAFRDLDDPEVMARAWE